MIELLDRLLRGVVTHGAWAGPAFGLLAFGESLALLGIVIPATPALFFIGTLIGSGKLQPAAVMPWIIAGAIAGYWLSWSVGRRIGPSVYHVRLLVGHRRGIARTRLFFRRWGGPSLIFGRYLLGPFQSMLPLVAGVAGMGARRFHAWSVVSGVTWAFIVLAPGFLTARGVTLFGFGAAQQNVLVLALLGVSGALVVAAIVLPVARLLWRRHVSRRFVAGDLR